MKPYKVESKTCADDVVRHRIVGPNGPDEWHRFGIDCHARLTMIADAMNAGFSEGVKWSQKQLEQLASTGGRK